MPKRSKPDKRLNWRDPNMPVLRYGNVNGSIGTHEIAPQHIQQYYKKKLEQVGWQMPDWNSDPTYFLKKRK